MVSIPQKGALSSQDLEDISFVRQYLEYVSRRSGSRIVRARAALLLSTMGVLDTELPGWWALVVAELKASDQRSLLGHATSSDLLFFGPDALLSKALGRLTEPDVKSRKAP